MEISQEAVDFYDATRVQSNLIGTKMSASFPDCQVTKRCALIVVARVLVPGRRHGTGTTATAELSTYVALLVFANASGQVLAYYVATGRGIVKPADLQVMPQGIRKDCLHMRRSLLAYLGREKLLVWFNLTWTLTALQLAVDATRVVDVGLEPAYQRWCCQLSHRYKRFVDMLVPNLCSPFDRRWPAFLGDLELMPNGRDDIFRYTLYTAAIWQVIRERVAADRANVELHLLKRLYKIGCGAGVGRRELFSLEDEQNLLERTCPQSRKEPALPSG